jgi:hypothetical protein
MLFDEEITDSETQDHLTCDENLYHRVLGVWVVKLLTGLLQNQ